MDIKNKITQRKNWKNNIRIVLTIPLLIIMVYLIYQIPTTDLNTTEITGQILLGAKENKEINVGQNISSSIITKENLIDKLFYFYLKDKESNQHKEKNKTKKDKIQENNTNEDNDNTVGSGGSSGGNNNDDNQNTPDTTPTENNTLNDTKKIILSEGTMPEKPTEIWGIVYVNNIPVNADETIIVKINNTEQQITTVNGGYYTITAQTIEDTIFFRYDGQEINDTGLQPGEIKELNLYFN